MKFIIKTLVVIVAALLITGVTLYSMGNDKVDVTESRVINKTPEELFNTVGNLNTFKSWSPWADKDPDMKQEVTGTPVTVGHKNSWTGNDEVGEGMQQITALESNKKITMDLEFIKPSPSKSIVIWDFEAVEGGTKVTWHTEGPLDAGGRIFDGLMDFNAGISKDFKQGLENLSNI